MTWMIVILVFLASAILTWRFTNPASRFHVVDHPNERSLHARPTPRSGGIAILAALTSGVVMYVFESSSFETSMLWNGAALMLVAAISFIDDKLGVSAAYRFVAHLIGAGLLLAGGLSLQAIALPGAHWVLPDWAAVLVTTVLIVWMINLYNFMDGMDGFAAGMAVNGFIVYSIYGSLTGHESYAAINAITAASVSGFLCFNFPPAKIFMGDIGSSVLGLLAASFSLWGIKDGVYPFWVPMLVFSPFIADATVTLFRRLLRGEKIWQAHKTHYYQLLVQAGWGHRKTVLIEYGIMLGCGVTALWSTSLPTGAQTAVLVVWLLFYSFFFFWISRYASRHNAYRQHAK